MTIEVVKGVETYLEPETGVSWVDNTNGEVSVHSIEPAVRRVARQVARWMGDSTGQMRGGPSLINRQSYASPESPYEVMRTCYQAVEHDDVVGGVVDVTEGLMFQGLQMECEDPEEADIFNQLSTDLNLDQFARQWHREESTYSQAVVGFWWGTKTYKVRKVKTKAGRTSKKTFTVYVPTALTFMDPRKVVPLQPGPFGQDNLAWQSSQDEYTAYVKAWQTGAYADEVMRAFFDGPVQISEPEKQYLRGIGVQPEYLIRLNPDRVKRFTRTKVHYERFPIFRLKRTFVLLDLKQHLAEADRVTLVGAANYILLVRQGSEKEPAEQGEIDNLQENFKVIAKVPVVIGDHRLSIDIITPKQDQTLTPSKYDTLDRRIISTTLGALTVASSGQRNESSLTIARGVGRLLESRRQMFKRFVEDAIIRETVNHPSNAGAFKTEPNLAFTPRQIQLDEDDAFLKAVMDARGRREMSRQTFLETLGIDQAVEAMRLEIEADRYDDIFKTAMPFDSPDNNANRSPGRPAQPDAGGQPQGGAEAPRETPTQSGTRGGRPPGS